MSREWWGFVFLMVVMKVPIAYLAGVVWYACKAPDPPEPARKLVEAPEPGPECPWQVGRVRPRGPRPPHAPRQRVGSARRVSSAYAHRR